MRSDERKLYGAGLESLIQGSTDIGNSSRGLKSIYDNIAYGLRIHGIRDKRKLDRIVEESLRGVAVFDEVKNC